MRFHALEHRNVKSSQGCYQAVTQSERGRREISRGRQHVLPRSLSFSGLMLAGPAFCSQRLSLWEEAYTPGWMWGTCHFILIPRMKGNPTWMSFCFVCLLPEGLLEISLPCNVSGCGRKHQFSPYEDLLYCLAYFSAVSWNCKIGNDKTCRNES